MPLYGAHRIDRYSATFSPEALIAAFARLGFRLQPADDFIWDGADEQPVTVRKLAPVIRPTAKASVLQLALAPWGIRDVRRPMKAGPIFNFPTKADDFRLSARILVPLSAIPGVDSPALSETIQLAAAIERNGAWTLLVRERDDGGAVRPIMLPSSRRCKAWLSRGDAGDRRRSL